MTRSWAVVCVVWWLGVACVHAYSIAESVSQQLHTSANELLAHADYGVLAPLVPADVLARSHEAVKGLEDRMIVETADQTSETIENDSKFEYWSGLYNAAIRHLNTRAASVDVINALGQAQINRTRAVNGTVQRALGASATAQQNRETQLQSRIIELAVRKERHEKLMETIKNVTRLLQEQIEAERHVRDSRVHFPIFNHLLDVMEDKLNVSAHQAKVLLQYTQRKATHDDRYLHNVTNILNCAECSKRVQELQDYVHVIPQKLNQQRTQVQALAQLGAEQIEAERFHMRRLSMVMVHANNTHEVQAAADEKLGAMSQTAEGKLGSVESFFSNQKRLVPHLHVCVLPNEAAFLASLANSAPSIAGCGLTCTNNNITCTQRCVSRLVGAGDRRCSQCLAFASQCMAVECAAPCTRVVTVGPLQQIRTIVDTTLPECMDCARKSMFCLELAEKCK